MNHLEGCPVCYQPIYLGIKQLDCHSSHYICITCFAQHVEYYRCCMCRRSTDTYILYSRKQNKTVCVFNELPEIMELYLSALNLSRQTGKSLQTLVSPDILKPSSINYHQVHRFLMLLFLSATLLSLFMATDRADTRILFCYTNGIYAICRKVDYRYVYLIARLFYLCLFLGTTMMCGHAFVHSWSPIQNPFKTRRMAYESL